MKKDVDGIIRKRNLIAKTRKTVLFWVGGAASVVGAMVVVAVILTQSLLFNQKVISLKSETLKTIENNISVVSDLNADVRLLGTNEELRSVRTSSDAPAQQSILDALPADGNRLALGASLQQKIFDNVPGLTVDSLSVDPSVDTGDALGGNGLPDGLKELAFTASISGTPDALRLGLQRLEKSVRAINVKTINGTSSGTSVSLQITGSAYYLPPADLGLTKKEVKG